MNIGVTGGQGFIGSWVIRQLIMRRHSVIVMDHKKRPAPQYINNPKVDYLWGDVRDPVAMMELAAHCEGIIHLAAVLGTQETIRDPRPAVETNLQGGLNFLEAISHYDIPGVNICVGNHWMNNPYSISKTAVERFCTMYRDERGTKVNQVRAVNAYGPFQRAAPPFAEGKVRKIIPAFVCRALSGMPVEVYGDGTQISDMVWVGDLAHVLVRALEEASSGNILQSVAECGPVASSLTVNDIANVVIDECAKYTGRRSPLTHLPMRPGEEPGAIVRADTTTLEPLDVNANMFLSIYSGIEDTVGFFAEVEGSWWSKP